MRAASALAILSVASLGEVTARFQPFSDVEELRPHRLHEHCGTERFVGPDGREHRKCERHIKKTLDDDGELEFGWSMDADPDRILSLDTEAEHGVRLLNCFPDELELDLPESHIHHAKEGQLVVASRFLHNCEHLGERHLFHRVKLVKTQNWRDVLPTSKRAATVRIMTEELPSLAHAVPSLNFHFKWMPYEALQDEDFPEMRTDFGQNRQTPKSAEEEKKTTEEEHSERKLFSFGDELKKLEGTSEDNGGFASKNQERTNVDNSEGILNLMPKQLSNFGWNWDFFMNTTQQPNFEVEVPGARARWKIRKPYVKVHAGIYLNFSSQFGGLTEVPHVRWTWGVNARGRVQGRFFGSMNTTSDAGTDPFVAFKLPVFEEFEQPMWFHKIDFATGELPITMEPGVQMTASMYHHGRFSGALGGGGKTSGWWNPALGYDSQKGLVVGWIGNLTDTTFWPPIWMIFTRAFEMGVIMKPTILMKGDFAGLERATMKIETRPYANVSIVRENPDGSPAQLFNKADAQGGTSSAESGKTLTVYPIRVIGLSSNDLDKKYKIRIQCQDKVVETTPHPNWGTVKFRDHITTFNMGAVAWKELTDPNVTTVILSLIEVDSNGQNRTLGTGSAICSSLVGDQCLPSPTNVNFMAGGQVVAQGSVAMLWSIEPEVWFPTMIEGLAFDLPSVIVREDTLARANPDVDAEKQDVFAKIIQGGMQYVLPLKSDGQGGRKSEVGITIPPGFVDDWSPCSSWSDGGACPRIELWAGSKKIGVSNFPEIQFTSKTAMQGTASSSFLGKKGPKMDINSWIEMRAPGADDTQPAIATMQLNTKVYSTLDSSMFLSPRSAIEVAAGSRQKVMWTVSNVDRSQNYDFTLHALTLKGPSGSNWESYEQYRQVGSDVLVPVGTPERFSTRCSALTSSGLPASSAPCVFSTTFSFEGSSFEQGAVVVLVVQWTGPDGSSQELTSSPISLGTAGNFGRRLGEELTELFESQQLQKAPEEEPLLRRLWNKDVWNARTEQYSSCKDRNLRFNMGMGLLVRGKVDGLSVPDGFPMLGGTSSQPGMATDFKTIFAEEPGKEANDAFGGPDSLLCQAGLCEGALPGCTKVAEKGIYAPTLLLNFNRKYLFDKDAEGLTKMMRTALAYAFSTMPETVDLMVSELNKTAMERKAAKQASGTTERPWYSAPSSAPSPTDWQPVQTTASPFAPSPAPIPAPTGETTDAFNKWWSGADAQRRLAAAAASGRREVIPTFEEIPASLEPHQAKLHFKDGIDFVMNRALVQLMVQSGYLDNVMEDVEDDLYHTEGPLRITSFAINSGVPQTEELWESDLSMHELGAARTSGLPILSVVGGIIFFLLLSAAALYRSRSQQYHKLREGMADVE